MTSLLKPMELDLDITSGQLVYLPSPNFSYNFIPYGCVIRIPCYQEMILSDEIDIEGDICLDGDLSFID